MSGAGGASPDRRITLLLAGDVMTGRGVDQVLAHPGDPRIVEPHARSAREYVALAETASGPVGAPLSGVDLWGDALAEIERAAPGARIVNLETAVTASDDAWPGKRVNYRMHPANAGCLVAAGIDCCVLANNHVLDWGRDGLVETLETLGRAGIRTAGAGRDAAEAAAPAVVELPGGGRVLVVAACTEGSGVPAAWAATGRRPGVRLLPDLSERRADELAGSLRGLRRAGDLVVASLHWGGNWGWEVPDAQRRFAHRLVERGGVHVVHGHSSHHVKGIEVHRGRLVLHGCGDLIDDYEGVGGHEEWRGDLGLLYRATVEVPGGRLVGLEMTPTRMRRLRLRRAGGDDLDWLRDTLTREGRDLGTRVEETPEGRLTLRWSPPP